MKASSLSKKEKRRLDRQLKIKFYKAVKLLRIDAGITVENEPWVYKVAFPNLTELYWLFRVGMRKLGIGR